MYNKPIIDFVKHHQGVDSLASERWYATIGWKLEPKISV